MPSKTKKQAAAMRAACHSKKKGKIPKDVACEFVKADKAKKARRHK